MAGLARFELASFYDYMTSHNFKLNRGVPIEESGRKHLDLKDYKDVTNFDKTKEKLQNIKFEFNENLHNEVEKIKSEYKQKEFDIEWKYKSKIRGLEKETHTS